ncbi:MAG: glycosyltransferase [Acidobacteriaceae bacterium]|nr:glycosyltransferase [Acidobacteriaceae bacterium]
MSQPAVARATEARPASEALLTWGPQALHARNARIRQHQSEIAASRANWIWKNRYYYELLSRLLRHVIEPDKRILNVRCQIGLFLDAINPAHGVGVDISPEMIDIARQTHPRFTYFESSPEDFQSAEKFDYILLCDVGEIVDIERTLLQIRSACDRHSRLVIYSYNHLWEPVLRLAQKLRLKIPQAEQSWLSEHDLIGLLSLAGFEWLKTYRTALFPKYIPLASTFANRILAKLPLLNRLCMIQVLIARLAPRPLDPSTVTVSVVVPCKDEKGNIEDAVRRTPELGRRTELIFCDDKSTDGTGNEVRRMQQLYPDRLIRLVNGPGICKSKNVWTGFEAATGDILAILDADLTVMPEELPYFIHAITNGQAEFVNGSRLVYPIPKSAMKGANMAGNKFFSLVFSYLLGQRIKDTLCGTKVMWRSDWNRMRPMVGTWGTMDRWGDYDLLFGAAKLNLRILDQPVHYQERIYGATKMTKVFKNGLIMLEMCLHGFRKLKVDY